MKPFVRTFSAALIVWFALVSAAAADNFPDRKMTAPRGRGPAVQQQIFYGYVPPPPIRHTWPGGYKVIFHELLNTLSGHVLGQY
ncbi:MAG TPA: hypothetical protein VMC85_20270 [Desulfomonilaceae bacterium]|nr:hypothetical protein [Desulfomonilaceae bacterium]